MKFGKAVIVGCLKNSAEFLPRVFQNLENLANFFDEVTFIFIENDSIDATKEIASAWGENQKKLYAISLGWLG